MLPGGMLRNRRLKFVCRQVNIRVESTDTFFTSVCHQGQVLSLPVAHNEGNFYADEHILQELAANKQIVFRYCDEQGHITEEANVNGSLMNIAGLCNKTRNVLGIMPHPERASEEALGSTDGRFIFDSIVHSFVSSAQIAKE